MNKTFIALAILCLLLRAGKVRAQPLDEDLQDMLSMPPEAFFALDLDVYSASRKHQKVASVPYAVYLIDAEEIRQSTARTLPDLLRLVPGLHVAQVSGNKWAISARGFNSIFANRLLVMVDGSIVTPFFNGVIWEAMDIPLNTIERIEIIRGPGAALWGGRATHGVVNIITRRAKGSEPHHVILGSGDETPFHIASQLNGRLSERTHYRLDMGYKNRDSSGRRGGSGQNHDALNTTTAHARLDTAPTDTDQVSLVASYTHSRADTKAAIPVFHAPYAEVRPFQQLFHTATFAADWQHTFSDTLTGGLKSSHLLQSADFGFVDVLIFNTDIEGQMTYQPTEWYEGVFGLNYRFYADDSKAGELVRFEPPQRTLNFLNAFVHNEIQLFPELLTLVLGSRMEVNEQTSFQWMPTARMLSQPTDNFTAWLGFTRAYTAPSRSHEDLRLSVATIPAREGAPATFLFLEGNREFDNEEVLAYETGFRYQWSHELFVDVTGYYFEFNDLRTNEPGSPTINTINGESFAFVPLTYANEYRGETWGIEAALDFRPVDSVRLRGGYAYQDISARRGNSNDPSLEDFLENVPHSRFFLTSHIELTEEAFLTSTVRYVSGQLRSSVPSYTEVDVKVSWEPTEAVRLSLTGRNLLDKSHPEFKPVVIQYTTGDVERSLFLEAELLF